MSLSRYIQMGAAGPSGDDTFNPSDIDDLEIWLDSSDTSYLFQDAGKITAVTTNGDPVGCWADRSGNGYDHTVEGYDIANASYDNKSFSILSEEGTVQGLAFNNTGSKMYVIGSSSDKVHQYTLSTEFDVSTASYDNVNFSVSAQETSPRSVTFNNTGSKMYIVGQTNDIVCQYSLSSEFDLSTASFDNVSLNVSSQESTPQGVTFNGDGSKMYIIGPTTDEVHQYSLSSLFDLSTASYDSVSFDVSSQATSPRRAVFNSDGTKMFVVGQTSDAVSQYSLSTPYIVSSASYDSVQFSVNSQEATPRDVVFSGDGTKMYIVGVTNDSVIQYNTVANRPSYDTSTISGGSLFFDHTADSNAGEWLFNDTAKDTITAFFVVEVSSTLTGVLFGFDNSTNKYIHNDAGGAVYGTTPTSSYTNFNANSYTGFPVNTTSLLSADVCNFYRMNLTQYNPTTAFNYTGGSPDGTWIGRRSNAPTDNAPFRGNIAEVITYSRRLSSSEIDSVEGYLNTKWSLGL